jgi:hypothetical protein
MTSSAVSAAFLLASHVSVAAFFDQFYVSSTAS